MSLIRNREDALKKLHMFCLLEKVFGVHSNMWFESLKSRFPLEFIFYIQSTTRYPNSVKVAKKNVVKLMALKLDKLLEYQLDQNDIDFLNSTINEISERIKQKENYKII